MVGAVEAIDIEDVPGVSRCGNSVVAFVSQSLAALCSDVLNMIAYIFSALNMYV